MAQKATEEENNRRAPVLTLNEDVPAAFEHLKHEVILQIGDEMAHLAPQRHAATQVMPQSS